MTELVLKEFQQAALETLAEFLRSARLDGNPSRAFRKIAGETRGVLFREYRPLEGLPGVPSVCLRLPTGGGKTLLAAHAVGVMAQEYLEREFPLVLWLAPSDAIRTQTLEALNKVDHPYRQALAGAFGGQVRVFDLSEFTRMRPQDLRSNACVLVGTMQTLQVTDTNLRTVYAHNENLEDWFRGAMAGTVARAEGLELIEAGRAGAGGPRFSLANLLKVQRPLVVLDEAHKFVTTLAREVRRRIGPSAVLELTATPPDEQTNVLYRASAKELQAEQMIKLPVNLKEHKDNWQEAVCEAVRTRRSLAELAQAQGESFTPVLLIQTQDKAKEANWEVVRRHLIETERLREEEIAVQTQSRKDLAKVLNLGAPECPVTTVLTVRALMEGWDCPPAYVLCSTANVQSATDVEQLLGRVLRLPGARLRQAPELNEAYAHVASAQFGLAAAALRDALVRQGFEPKEALAAVKTQELPMETSRPALRVYVPSRPVLDAVRPEERGRIKIEELAPGKVEIVAEGPLAEEAAEALVLTMPGEPEREELKARIAEHNESFTPSPSERGARFSVPRQVIDIDGVQLLFDADTAHEATEWRLGDYPADISKFDYDETTRAYTLDLEGQQFTLTPEYEAGQMSFLPVETTVEGLVSWLSKPLKDLSLKHDAIRAWVLDAVTRALGKPHITLDVLDRGKFILLRKLKELLAAAKRDAAEKGCKRLLDFEVVTDVTDEFAFDFAGKPYPANWFYSGWQKFRKHYFPKPGELESTGEELACAVELDALEEVEFWVRNLEGQERRGSSVWLQTPKARFYPDFVAKLKDGRALMVEYKGAHLLDSEDTRVKRTVGKLWADKSGRRAIFAMVSGRDVKEHLQAAIREPARGLY